MTVTFTSSGSFGKMEKFLKTMKTTDFKALLASEAEKGRQALILATPRDSGVSAASWSYQIDQNRGGLTLTWTNSNVVGGIPLVVMLQYGHGTGTGGYVQGRDFINPAMKPIFDKIADNIWKAVTSA